MKRVVLILGLVILFVNVVFGLLLSCYPWFNCILNSGIIVFTVVMLHCVSLMTIKDGYKVAFNCIFPLCCLIELVCGFISPDDISDNGCIISIIILFLIQVILLIVSNSLSNNVKN